MSEARTFKITRAKNAGEKDNPHGGKLVKWYLDFESGESDVYCQKKPGNDLEVGQEIYGRVKDGEFGPRFFSEQNQNVQSTSTDGRKGRPRDPDLDHRIARQVAFKGAVEIYSARLEKGTSLPTNEVVEGISTLTASLLPIIEGPDSYPNQAKQVAQTLSTGPQKPSPAVSGPGTLQNGGTPRPTKEALQQAFKEFAEREGPDAKKKLDLKLASLGVVDTEKMTDKEATQVLDYLTNG